MPVPVITDLQGNDHVTGLQRNVNCTPFWCRPAGN